jgi:hypothetical protein
MTSGPPAHPAEPQPAPSFPGWAWPLLALAFLAELGMLAAFVVGALALPAPPAVRGLVAVAAPLAGAVLWGAYLAPKARRPLRDPARLGLEVAVFGAAVVALALAGHPVWAGLLGTAALLTVPLSHRPQWLRRR